jgi:hypothetical protein
VVSAFCNEKKGNFFKIAADFRPLTLQFEQAKITKQEGYRGRLRPASRHVLTLLQGYAHTGCRVVFTGWELHSGYLNQFCIDSPKIQLTVAAQTGSREKSASGRPSFFSTT